MLRNKFRQISILSLVLCMILTMLPMSVFAASDDTQVDCEHLETYMSTFESSCVRHGTEQVICKNCNEVISEKELPLSDEHVFYNGACLLCKIAEPTECEHDYEVVREQAPTCTEAGYAWEKCTKCGDEYNHEVGEPTGEHSDETYLDIYESTCVKNGYEKTRCKVCDAVLSEKELPLSDEHIFHNDKCLLCGIDAPCKHEYEVVKEQAPTCKEAGYVWEKCTKCGNEHNYEVGEPTGKHSDETYLDIYESTCVKNGYEKTRCKVCDEVLSEKELPLSDEHVYYNGACLLCGVAEPCKHEYETVKELAPTCKEAGYVWTKCTKCGNEKNYEVGEPTGVHSDETYLDIYESTCVKNGYEKTRCKVCDEVLSEKELPLSDEHAFYNGACLLCGVAEPCKHEYETVKELAPTCNEAGYVWEKCTKCGDEHNYEVGEPTGEHTYDNACDANCNVCNAAREVEDHKYDNACDANCNVCEAERTVGEHKYDDEYDADCNECGAKREVPTKPVETPDNGENEGSGTGPDDDDTTETPDNGDNGDNKSEDTTTTPDNGENEGSGTGPDGDDDTTTETPDDNTTTETPDDNTTTETPDDNTTTETPDDNTGDVPSAPQTGDTSNMVLWIGLMMVSVLGMAIVIKKRNA